MARIVAIAVGLVGLAVGSCGCCALGDGGLNRSCCDDSTRKHRRALGPTSVVVGHNCTAFCSSSKHVAISRTT